MAVVAGRTEIGIRRVGVTVQVPANYTARLMFYFNSICDVLNLSSEGDLHRLRNYRNWYQLSDDEIDRLLVLCALLKPEDLLDKCIFYDHDGEMCGNSQNAFYELSAVETNFAVTDSILIGGQRRQVKKIMFFTPMFLKQNYYDPMIYYNQRLQNIAALLDGRRQPQRQAIAYPQRQAITYTQPTSSYHQPIGYYKPKSSCCTIL